MTKFINTKTDNFAKDIESAAEPEKIDAIVISPMGSYSYEQERHEAANKIAGRVLSWEEARPALDYMYDSGFGDQDCHEIFAYTNTRVIYVHEYDGSSSLMSVPRNPTPVKYGTNQT